MLETYSAQYTVYCPNDERCWEIQDRGQTICNAGLNTKSLRSRVGHLIVQIYLIVMFDIVF